MNSGNHEKPCSHRQLIQSSLIPRSFVRSLLRAGVQPTLDPSGEIFISVQCEESNGNW